LENKENNMTKKDKVQKQITDLTNNIWKMANELRGSMDANEFKSYILGTMFYKFLSDKTVNYINAALKNDGMTYEEAWNDEVYKKDVIDVLINEIGYAMAPDETFSHMIKLIETKDFSVSKLEKAITSIVNSTQGNDSEEIFANIFSDMDLDSSKLGRDVKSRSDLIAKIFNSINSAEMDFDDSRFDVLGSAYIELINKFGMSAGKKGGEFYSPTPTCKLCARLATIGMKTALTAADVACGSGSMLLEINEYCDVVNYYGQEKNNSTSNLAKMNMILHNIDYDRFLISNVDTLKYDPTPDTMFDIQVANPPYSLKWEHTVNIENDERFATYGKLAPKSHADLAFLQHMIHHMAEDGRIAILLPHGVLFRGNSEEQIRKHIIEKQNYLDAVIGLPAGMFSTTGIPVVCLVLRKQRNGDSDNICFIDASKHFTKKKTINVMTDEDIDRIVNAYTERKDIDKYCHIATIEEIRENNYNLNIPRYVDTFEEEEPVNIKAEFEAISEIDKEIKETETELNKYFEELGLGCTL